MKKETVIHLLHDLRRGYATEERFHYYTFCTYVLILLLDFIIIMYTRLITLNGYAWAGIIILFSLISVEAMQSTRYKTKKESVDTFYLSGELR